MLFLTIFKEYRLSLTPVLLQLVEANQGPCNPDDMQAILKKDAGTLQPNILMGGGGGGSIDLLVHMKVTAEGGMAVC